MPSQGEQPQRDELREWTLDDWNDALCLHYFSVPPGEPVAPLVTLNVTGEDLREASNCNCTPDEARTAFIGSIKRAVGSASLDLDAARRGLRWSPDSSAAPPFLSHLFLTCMVANDLAEELRWTGNFRIRLSQVLDTTSQPLLQRLPALWEELAAWSVRQNLSGAGCRRLRLPQIPRSGYYSIIGYSIRLAVPSRRDQKTLAALFRQNGLNGREPELTSVLRVVSANLGRFSPDFKDVFNDFISALKSQPTSILAQTAFWTAIRNVAVSGLETADRDPSAIRVRLELEDDDGSFWLALTGDTEINSNDVRSLILPTLRQSSFRHLLTDRDGNSLAKILFSSNTVGPRIEMVLRNIRSTIAEGLLLFEETDDYVFVLSTATPSSGSLRALVSDRLKSTLKQALDSGGIRAEITRSTILGWSEWRGLTAEALRSLDISRFTALESVRSLRITLPPAEIKLRGGIRFGSSFIALSSALPRVEIASADQVTIELSRGQWQTLEIDSDIIDTWRFPPATSAAQLLGSHHIVAFAASVPIAERHIHFIEGTFTTDYKQPSDPDRWLIESTNIDAVPFSENRVCLLPVDVKKTAARVNTPPVPEKRGDLKSSANAGALLSPLTTILSSRFSAQRGISEGEIVPIMASELGLTASKLWPVLRAWIEAGILEVLTDARWRAHVYFARTPRLVVHRRSSCHEAVLIGLLPQYLTERFERLSSTLGLAVLEPRSVSPFVPALPRCRSYRLSPLSDLARELNLPDIFQVCAPDELLTDVRAAAEQFTSTRHDSWPLFRRWDWQRRFFTEHPADSTVGGISIDWCRRDDGPDRYKVYRDGSLLWWTRSRTWATLTAFTLAGLPVFTRPGGAALESQGDSLYIPLPAARAISWIGPENPGPITLPDGRSAYRYTFLDETALNSVLSKLWPDRYESIRSVSPVATKRLAAILRTGRGPIVPLPAALRRALSEFRHAPTGHPGFVPASTLPELYALVDAARKGEI